MPWKWLIVVGIAMFLFRFVLEDGILIQFFPEVKIEWINH
jgi:hypothetical protein